MFRIQRLGFRKGFYRVLWVVCVGVWGLGFRLEGALFKYLIGEAFLFLCHHPSTIPVDFPASV